MFEILRIVSSDYVFFIALDRPAHGKGNAEDTVN
jgi:hypothetical protein